MKTLKLRVATYFVAFGLATFLLAGCETVQNMNKSTKGAVIGGAGGAVIGGVIGKKAGNTALGSILGAAVGGAAGTLIGKKMDRQAEEIRKNVPNAEVIQQGEGLIVKFDSGLLFAFGKADLTEQARANIAKLASSMQANPQTNILVVGHTDNVGSDSYNYTLSQRRAASVRDYLAVNGVSTNRVTTSGKGMTEPIADNSTEDGRAQNRRVEIVVVANDAMKQEAQRSVQ